MSSKDGIFFVSKAQLDSARSGLSTTLQLFRESDLSRFFDNDGLHKDKHMVKIRISECEEGEHEEKARSET